MDSQPIKTTIDKNLSETFSTSPSSVQDTVIASCDRLTDQAGKASNRLKILSSEQKNGFLFCLAEKLLTNCEAIVAANHKDMLSAKQANLASSLCDRLQLDTSRVQAMASSVKEVAALPDPVGKIREGKTLYGGVRMQKKQVPLGVVMVIFESRPNVTIDIAALCIKSGNACILKGGKEALHSNMALIECINQATDQFNAETVAAKNTAANTTPTSNTMFPKSAVQLVSAEQKASVAELLKRKNQIDVVVPRGGRALISHVQESSSIPVICHDAGICHLYVHQDAPQAIAERIAINAKVQRPGVCNAIETILIHKDYPHTDALLNALVKSNVEVRLHENLRQYQQAHQKIRSATQEDWSSEYLDLIVSVRAVDSVEQAIDFINTHGSHHTDAIVCNALAIAEKFQLQVDSSCVAVNTSTRYHDGSVFGYGSEVGTSTQKLHVRGTMCAEDLCTTKYVLNGEGQIRESF